MITIIEQGEKDCALCRKSKEGVMTQSEQYGEAFFCWPCIRKLTRLARPKVELPTPILDRLENGR